MNPNFGFLFLFEGEKGNHFIWEPLNSHAIYVWSFSGKNADIEVQYKRIEATVHTIRLKKRDDYKLAYNIRRVDQDLVFTPIHHVDIGAGLDEKFTTWRAKLDNILT